MRAMVFHEPHAPLQAETRDIPRPQEFEVLLRVEACAVCRTDLHVQDAELPDVTYPVVPGHQVVGSVEAKGSEAVIEVGDRVGVAWLGWTCGRCEDCERGDENLCANAQFTGYHRDGGYAEYMVADSRFCFPLDSSLDAAETTPLLCAGLIGFRSLRMAGDARRIGIFGFGSAAHIITQVAVRESREVYAFTRAGDDDAQAFARKLGAVWAGSSEESAPQPLDAALIFAPVGALVTKALRDVRPGGRVVCGGIHMSDIPSFPYADLWGERRIQSVANLTREDGRAFMSLAAELEIRPSIISYPLNEANRALDDLRNGAINGTAVLIMTED
ncbi:MAG: zinc-dependent alcohol dehydrogenase family protein [Deltaproteobacteria bacterium]|nr:zinc-dependent alcohol dehydrogenase family protein [Deltaproteobacteria bacterium]